MNGRATQLDGLRAVAILAICWDHWCPHAWPRIFPFEVFLFFFLVLTGFLITGSLLRERDRFEAAGGPWRYDALKNYQIRRGLRILAPYYVALALAWLLWTPDVHAALGWYVFQLSNIHMAQLGYWPMGTNHFWSLAMQHQFYLVWPLVIWFVPKRAMLPLILAFTAVAPLSRMFQGGFLQEVPWRHLLTWASFDYFGAGALLALAVHHGMSMESRGLRLLSAMALAGYALVFGAHSLGWATWGLRSFQQTMLAVGLCGIIAGGSVGYSGILKCVLEHPIIQRIGKVSYGVYLFHNLAPLVAGKIFWFLWGDFFNNEMGEVLRVMAFAGVTWSLAWASWRWIESPLQGIRTKLVPR